jgi:hypothetical protein
MAFCGCMTEPLFLVPSPMYREHDVCVHPRPFRLGVWEYHPNQGRSYIQYKYLWGPIQRENDKDRHLRIRAVGTIIIPFGAVRPSSIGRCHRTSSSIWKAERHRFSIHARHSFHGLDDVLFLVPNRRGGEGHGAEEHDEDRGGLHCSCCCRFEEWRKSQ